MRRADLLEPIGGKNGFPVVQRIALLLESDAPALLMDYFRNINRPVINPIHSIGMVHEDVPPMYSSPLWIIITLNQAVNVKDLVFFINENVRE